MRNDLINVEESDDEINFYEIFNIFMKNIKIFIIVSLIGFLLTVLYIGKRIIFNKNNTIYINYTLNYLEINSYLGNDVYYPKKNPEEILFDNKYLELLFENSELKELYEKEVKENRDNISIKRQFLERNKILETSSLKKLAKTKEEQDLISPNSYRTTVKINKREDIGRKISDSVMETYLDILKQYYTESMFDYLTERKAYLEKTLPILKKQLEENAISDKNIVLSNGVADNSYFKYLYPIKVSNVDVYYEKYKAFENEYQSIKTLFDLDLGKADNFIKYDSSIIMEKEKTENFVKLGIGVFLSLCIGLLAIFTKEFFQRYKENKENL